MPQYKVIIKLTETYFIDASDEMEAKEDAMTRLSEDFAESLNSAEVSVE